MVDGLITVSGTATDDAGVSKIEISFDGGTTYTTATGTAAWSINFDTTLQADGNLFIKAKATDSGGYTAFGFVTLIIDNAGPSVQIISPTLDQRLSGYFAVVGLGNKVDSVEVAIDGGTWQAATGNYTWSYIWDTLSVSQGAHTVSVRGVRGGVPGDVESLSVIVDQTVPSVSFTAPTIGEYIKGSKVISGVSADENGPDPDGVVDKVEMSTNGGVTYSTATGTTSWSYTLDTTALADGARILYARAKDVTGLFGTASIPITIDNNNPTVAITSHAGGEIVNGVLHLVGTGDDTVGLQKVDVTFGSNPTALADGTNSWNYDFNTAAVPNGAYTVVVRATDFAGNYKETSISVTVDQHLPEVATISLAEGAYLKGTVAVTGTATDGDGIPDITKVELKVGSGAYAPCTGTDSWSYSLNTTSFAPDGAKTVTVRVTDSQGGTGTVVRNVTFDNGAPTLAVSNPLNGAKVATNVLVVGTATDSVSAVSGVSLKIDGGAPLAATFAAPNWHCAWDTAGYPLGAHSLEVTATDLAGNTSTQTIAVDKTADVPSISITSPTNGAYLKGSVSITGSASAVAPATVVSVQIQVDSGALDTASGTDAWSYSLDTTALSAGSHIIKAIVTDSNTPTALTALTLISVTVDNTPPTVSITYPTSANIGASAVHGTINVSGSAADTNLLKVQVSIDGAAFADATGTTSFARSWDTTTVAGSAKDSVVLVAKAIDMAGNETSTTPISVDVHPYISSLSKSASFVGDTLSIYGDNFTATSTITFDYNGVPVAAVTKTFVNSQEYNVTIPTGATSGNVVVTTNGKVSNGVNLNIWKIDTVSSGAALALVLDGSNNIYVSHSYNAGGGNKYASLSKWNGSSWSRVEASPVMGGGGATATAVAVSGSNVYVAYVDAPASLIKVVKSTNGGASFGSAVNVTPATGTYSYLSMKVYNDGTDRVLIAYYNGGALDLMLARSTDAGATFGVETVDSTGDVGKYASLGLDTAHYPVIAYYDYSNRRLKLAYWDGGAWNTRVLDSSMAGEYASLAVAADGKVHVAYYDGNNGDQEYATALGPSYTFSFEGVDIPGITGWYGAIALDGNSVPHICYYDASYGTLRYAEKTSGSWTLLTVPEANVTQARMSIGVDSTNIQRIGYESGGSVKVARYLP